MITHLPAETMENEVLSSASVNGLCMGQHCRKL
jgi:hypothetical protein